jgi:ribosome-associated translation inhibitor RaiA
MTTSHSSIEIIARHVELSKDDRELAQLRCERIMDRFNGIVQSVTIRIEDINGPRGGVDKRCALIARLADGHIINAQRTAIHCGQAIGKSLDILRSKLRRSYGSRKAGHIMAA